MEFGIGTWVWSMDTMILLTSLQTMSSAVNNDSLSAVTQLTVAQLQKAIDEASTFLSSDLPFPTAATNPGKV